MKAYIISYNRLTSLRNLCRALEYRGCSPVIIDNSSNYPPLLEWLAMCHYEVHTVPNTGSRSPWIYNIAQGDRYIVTDSDLDISAVPMDMIQMLKRGLKENPTAIKSGLSLKIDDLPDNEYANKAKDHESRFWLTKAGDFYSAPIDTTLALYDAERLQRICKGNVRHPAFYNAVRSPPPYSATHLPWHNTPDNLSDEEKYYLNNLVIAEGWWNHEFKRVHNMSKF